MLRTLNLSAATRTAIENSLHDLRDNHGLRQFKVVAQSGAFLFCTARIDEGEHYTEAMLHSHLRPLRKVGYIPMVIVERVSDRTTVVHGGRATGRQAMLDAITHKEEIWQDETGDIHTGILRTRLPFILFTQDLQFVASSDPAAEMHLPKWIRAAERWRSLDPTRVKAGTA